MLTNPSSQSIPKLWFKGFAFLVLQAAEARRRQAGNLDQIEHEVADDDKQLSENMTVPLDFRPVLKPEWDECANDTFSVRLQVIERFVLMRVRAQQRSKMLWEAIGEAGVSDRKSCQAWVEAENKVPWLLLTYSKPLLSSFGQAAASGTLVKAEKTQKSEAKGTDEDTDSNLLIVHIPNDFVLPLQTPTRVLGFSAEERQPVEVLQLDNFEEFLPLEPPVRLDYKVLDYPLHEVPPPSAYMKPNNERNRLTAALEDCQLKCKAISLEKCLSSDFDTNRSTSFAVSVGTCWMGLNCLWTCQSRASSLQCMMPVVQWLFGQPVCGVSTPPRPCHC
eukprot:g10926.t1